MIENIQELKQKLEKLEQENAELKKKVEALKNHISMLRMFTFE
jgi:cell division protein FtsB